MKKDKEREKAFEAYKKQCKQWCHECGKNSYKPGDWKVQRMNKNKNIVIKKKMTLKQNILMEIVIIMVGEGIRVKIVMLRKTKKKEMKKWRKLLVMVMMMTWCYVC